MSKSGDALQEDLQTSGVRDHQKERREGQTCKEGCCEYFNINLSHHNQDRFLNIEEVLPE